MADVPAVMMLAGMTTSARKLSETLGLTARNLTMDYTYKKLNDEPILIEHVLDEHEESRDYAPSFWFRNRRHYLDDYIRTHNNPWIGCAEFPEYIHGMESDVYVKPLFIEIVDNGEAVNVYEEIAA